LLPTIVIYKEDVDWKDAYQKWINGGLPTKSPEWKKGVFAIFG
jgi:hypothetical protein